MPLPPYLSEDEIVELHDRVIGLLGGKRGLRDPDALRSCVAQPKTAVFGVERFPTIFDKAAAYCFYLVRLHPFFDGNKRTAFLAARTFLFDGGFVPHFDTDETYQMMISLVEGKSDIDRLASFFRTKCRSSTDGSS